MLHLMPVDIPAIVYIAVVAILANLVQICEQAHRDQRMRAEHEANRQNIRQIAKQSCFGSPTVRWHNRFFPSPELYQSGNHSASQFSWNCQPAPDPNCPLTGLRIGICATSAKSKFRPLRFDP